MRSAYLTPQATQAIKAANARHIAANNQRRVERDMRDLMARAMAPVRDVPAFVRSGFVAL